MLIALENMPACHFCAAPVHQPDAPCPHCQGEGVRPLERIARLALYRKPLRELILKIKYHGRWTLAEFLADRLTRQSSVQKLLADADLIVPVPLHPWRQFSRGFNQAQIVSRRLSKHFHRKLAEPIVRLKNTETQTHLHSKEKRFENLRDAFGLLRPKLVRDKHIVLVDDVITTGATLVSAARTILEAEPASISAIVLAVADAKGKDFESV
jgi:ComF family protein